MKKIVGSISSGVFGAITVHKFLNVRRLQKIIGEHNEVQKTIKDSQEFLNVVQKYVDDVELTDSEIPFIFYQFKTFNDKVAEFQTIIVKLKQ
ncbi:hypothetical protein C1646_172842 [Rhizophagus diaphanus]|nr:hypothetical protein C1646_172842 [Rhizophagus diaphanus] [Rhizophagus sp. MUCL 43196]